MVRAELNYLSSIITGDESLVYHYNRATIQDTSVSKLTQSPPPKNARQSKSDGKIMLIAFFDSKGMVYHNFVPPNTTINAAYYTSVLKTLRRHIMAKRPAILQNWVLHHDNARSRSAKLTNELLEQHGITMIPYPFIHQISHPVIFG